MLTPAAQPDNATPPPPPAGKEEEQPPPGASVRVREDGTVSLKKKRQRIDISVGNLVLRFPSFCCIAGKVSFILTLSVITNITCAL